MHINTPRPHGQDDVPSAERQQAHAPAGDEVRADISTEPERVAFPQSPWDPQPQRWIVFTWLVSKDDDGTEVLVQLSCHHSAPNYVANLNNALRPPEGSAVSAPFNARPLFMEQVTRYAKARFEAFAKRALAELRASADQPEVDAYLRGSHRIQR